MKTQLETLQNILENNDYQLTSEDVQTPMVVLALKNQQELKVLKENSIKYKVPVYKYKNEERLKPPAYQPSEHEIQLAMVRYVMEQDIWQTVHYLEMYINSLKGEPAHFPYTDETIEKSAQKCLSNWNEAMNKWDDNNEIWSSFVDKEWFEKVITNSLSDMHGGDCTAFASTCSRCYAEQIFKIPNTANWSKGEGYKMEKEFFEDLRAKKNH